MSFKIVVDSCADLPRQYHEDPRFEFVPLFLEVGDYHVVDDETFDQKAYLEHVAASPVCARSACPSPDRYMRAYQTEAEDVYVFTLSSKLSGSYNSALIGRDIYHEEIGEKNIFICDSLSACCGESNQALKAMELAESGLPFEEVVQQLSEYRDHMNTYFVLNDLETLRKNGRLTRMKALVANTLRIKPICGGIGGEVVQRGQAIGLQKALTKMADLVRIEAVHPEEKRLMITHVNCYERALEVQRLIEERVQFKECIIVDAAGVATTYAGDGGIVVTC